MVSQRKKTSKKTLVSGGASLLFVGGALVFLLTSPQIRFFGWTSGIHSGIRSFFASSTDFLSGTLFKAHVARVAEDLRAENERLYACAVKEKMLEEENRLLRSALSLEERFSLSFTPARVTGFQSDGFSTEFFVKGAGGDPVAVGAPVVSETGILIGKVASVKGSYALVTALSDPRMVFTGEVIETGASGVLRGRGFQNMRFELLDRAQELREGHIIMTSAIGEVFPPGLPLGKVVRVERSDLSRSAFADVEGLVDLRFLKGVLILNAL